MRTPLLCLLFLLSIERLGAGAEPSLGHLVIDGLGEPVRLELRATFDGVSWPDHFAALHDRQLRSLFKQLDADGDAQLSRDEARRLPRPEAFGRRGPAAGVHVAFNFLVLDADGNGGADFAELVDYLARYGDAPLLLDIQQRSGGHDADLFTLLDADRDRRLTPDEWSAAQRLLGRDRDGNRVLSNDELAPPNSSIYGPEFIAVPSGHGPGRTDITLRHETAANLASHGVVTLAFQSQADGDRMPSLSITLLQPDDRADLRIEDRPDGSVWITRDGQVLKLHWTPPRLQRKTDQRLAIIRQYDAAAERGDGFVRLSDELTPSLQALFAVGDANGDGNLERAELEGCVDGFVAASHATESSRLRLVFMAPRRSLNAVADSNLDGRLSFREALQLPERLRELAADQAAITREDVPVVAAIVLQSGPFDAATDSALTESGPAWFARADRNRDGDLDPREFVGSPLLFQQFDLNHDGWLDVHEALRADQTITALSPSEVQP